MYGPAKWGAGVHTVASTANDFTLKSRTAVANEYKLDKEQTSYNDILDAFRLSLQFYKRSKG